MGKFGQPRSASSQCSQDVGEHWSNEAEEAPKLDSLCSWSNLFNKSEMRLDIVMAKTTQKNNEQIWFRHFKHNRQDERKERYAKILISLSIPKWPELQ